MNTPRSTLSLRRALGEGPEALAIVLAGLWLAGAVALPLGHAVEHRSAERAHCHAESAGAAPVCHGGDASEREAGPSVREGGRPELAAASACHDAIVAAPLVAVTVVAPPRMLLPMAMAPASRDVHSGRIAASPTARGPPTSQG